MVPVYQVAPGLWKPRSGPAVKISHMENGHLVNTIRMLERAGKTSHPQYEMLLAELKCRQWKVYRGADASPNKECQVEFNKEKPYGVIAGNGYTDFTPRTEEEATERASQFAAEQRQPATILKVVAVVKPRLDVTVETW